jgi:hypothetical protein
MKWLSVRVGGQRWRVDLVKGNSRHFEGEDCYGITLSDKCRIYIAKEQDEQAREDTLLHELMHAALHVSGASQKLTDGTEEDIVRGLVLVLHPLLKDLGFRFPRGPQ